MPFNFRLFNSLEYFSLINFIVHFWVSHCISTSKTPRFLHKKKLNPQRCCYWTLSCDQQSAVLGRLASWVRRGATKRIGMCWNVMESWERCLHCNMFFSVTLSFLEWFWVNFLISYRISLCLSFEDKIVPERCHPSRPQPRSPGPDHNHNGTTTGPRAGPCQRLPEPSTRDQDKVHQDTTGEKSWEKKSSQ